MPVVTYVDPDTIHNPASGTVAPATWFTTHESNFRSIVGRVGASINATVTQDVTTPGPTTITLGNVAWNNGMTTSTANTIIVPASYGGKYLIAAGLRLDSTTAGSNFIAMDVLVNGGLGHRDYARRSTAVGSLQACAYSFVYALAVADALTLSVTASAANPTDVDTYVTAGAEPYLAAIWLSA